MTGLKIADVRLAVSTWYSVQSPKAINPGNGYRRKNPRMVAMALSRDLTPSSWAMIARAFGGYHHTTALHAHRRAQQWEAKRPAVREDLEQMRLSLAVFAAQRAASLEGAL